MVLLLAQKRWQWGREIGDSIITGDSNEREMLGKCKLLTAWECAKKLMLHCAAELVNVQIPVQVCRSFQTRDILCYKALWVFLTTAMGNKYLVFANPSYVTYWCQKHSCYFFSNSLNPSLSGWILCTCNAQHRWQKEIGSHYVVGNIMKPSLCDVLHVYQAHRNSFLKVSYHMKCQWKNGSQNIGPVWRIIDIESLIHGCSKQGRFKVSSPSANQGKYQNLL